MEVIDQAGRGVVVLIREPSPDSLTTRLQARIDHKPPPRGGRELREYGVGAQILVKLGVRSMVLLSNTSKTIVGLDAYGLTVAERRPIPKDAAGGA